MKPAAWIRFGGHRIGARIYLVSALSVIAVSVALYVIATLTWPKPKHGGPFVDIARHAGDDLSERWGSREAVRHELDSLWKRLRVVAAVYELDGSLVASSSAAPFAPLTTEERDELARKGLTERGGTCAFDHCQVVVAVGAGTQPSGYAILEQAPPPGPPPRRGPGPVVVSLAFLLVALGAAAALVGRSIAHPLERLASTAHRLGKGDLKARTGLVRRDELGEVALAFDGMADRLERLLRAQTELLANVAHELRTPLARIRVALDLAEQGDAGVARESLGEIAEDLGELEGLVDDILASARLDLSQSTTGTSTPPLNLASVRVPMVVNAAAERLRHRHPDRNVTVELDPNLPSIRADAVLLRRALDNLLDNARKYSVPTAPIRVRASLRDGHLAIDVIDAGRGMSPEDVSRLFTPFFRGDRSRARSTGGIGLGLVLARRIAEAHDGTLVAESTENVGTRMTLTLPAESA